MTGTSSPKSRRTARAASPKASREPATASRPSNPRAGKRTPLSLARPANDESDKGGATLRYSRRDGVDAYASRLNRANPLQLVQLERAGVPAAFINDLSARMKVPAAFILKTLGISKATAARKAAEGKAVTGSGGHAAIAVAKLLGITQDILANSMAPEARHFDAAKWLGEWLERPQPALAGRSPADLLDTPTGFEIVARLLRAVESGSYQ